MSAPPRSRKPPPPPPPHPARGWALGIAATLIATATIQAVRAWISADAYKSDVVEVVAPVEKKADIALQAVDQIANDLATARLQTQKNVTDTEIYKLEKSRSDEPKKWNGRDDLRLKDLMEAQQKAVSKLEAVEAK